MTIRPYQRDGALWLASARRRYLADDPGLGKSLQAITAADKVKATRVLVVCPASVVPVWAAEFRKWQAIDRKITVVDRPKVLDTLDYKGVTICSYERAEMVSRHLATGRVHVLIVDEAHFLKTRTAKRTRRILPLKGEALVSRADYAWFLSGTPAPNNPSEIWPVLRSCFPEVILDRHGKPMDFWAFAQRYCNVVNTGFGMQIKGGKRLDELRQRIAPVFLRRRVAEVLQDLPDMMWHDLPVAATMPEMGDTENAALVRRLEKAIDAGEWGKVEQLAAELGSYRRLVGLAKVDGVVSVLKDELDSGAVQKVVLWAWHRDVMGALALALADYGVESITGDTSPERRRTAVENFQSKPSIRVFIGQIRAAGTGLTLTAAHEEVFIEQSWSPMDNVQAAKRCHRIGQTRPVRVRVAYAAGSIDERIATALREKAEVIGRLFDEAAA